MAHLAVPVGLRTTTANDAPIIAHHRARMFHDMGAITDEGFAAFERAALEYYERVLPEGKYFGFLAHPVTDPDSIIAGMGVQVRWVAPFPRQSTDNEVTIATGKQGLIVNVFTEPEWRRRGVARQLMHALLRWAGDANIDSLILHAAPDGRALYEQVGFLPTNEMRFAGPLPHSN